MSDGLKRRSDKLGITVGGEINPEYLKWQRIILFYGLGTAALITAVAPIHPAAQLAALDLSLLVATVLILRSGIAPPGVFGRGWHPVKRSENPVRYWLSLSTIAVPAVICTGFLVYVLVVAPTGSA